MNIRNPLLVIIFLLPIKVHAGIDFSKPITCIYQFGQVLDFDAAYEAKNNSTPLSWSFKNMANEIATFESGGDTGRIHPIKMGDGFILYLPFNTGTHSFTVWSSGQSFWSKQVKNVGTNMPYSEQIRGICSN